MRGEQYSQNYFILHLGVILNLSHLYIEILYYDNGQHELNRILNTVLATQLVDYDVRKVIPSEYRLFQSADLICTLGVLRVKTEHQELSNSERRIFHSKRDLKKDFLKGIKKKEFV